MAATIPVNIYRVVGLEDRFAVDFGFVICRVCHRFVSVSAVAALDDFEFRLWAKTCSLVWCSSIFRVTSSFHYFSIVRIVVANFLEPVSHNAVAFDDIDHPVLGDRIFHWPSVRGCRVVLFPVVDVRDCVFGHTRPLVVIEVRMFLAVRAT